MAGRKRKVSVRRQQQHQQGRFLLKQYHHPSSGHQSKSWCVHIFSLAGRNYSFESRHHQIDLQMWRMTGNLFNKYIEEGLSCMQQHKWCYIGDSLCLKLCIVDATCKRNVCFLFLSSKKLQQHCYMSDFRTEGKCYISPRHFSYMVQLL